MARYEVVVSAGAIGASSHCSFKIAREGSGGDDSMIFESLSKFFSQRLGEIPLADILAIAAYAAAALLLVILSAAAAALSEMNVALWRRTRKRGRDRSGRFRPVAHLGDLFRSSTIGDSEAARGGQVLAPYLAFVAAFSQVAIMPLSSAYIGARLNVGVAYLIALGSVACLGILADAWSTDDDRSLRHSLGSFATRISSCIPIGLALLATALLAGSLDLQTITHLQSGGIQNWFLFGGPKAPRSSAGAYWVTPFMLLAFAVYFVASLASNRKRYGVPEAETEIVAGYRTHYSGARFALLLLAEYTGIFATATVAAVVFLGGWQSPFGDILGGALLGFFWVAAKALFFISLQIWVRWMLPRLRVHHFMNISWRVLTPMGIVALLGVATATTFLR